MEHRLHRICYFRGIFLLFLQRFVEIVVHGLHEAEGGLLAVGVVIEPDDVVHSPFGIVAAEEELHVDGLNGAMKNEVDQRPTLRYVQLLELDVAGFQIVGVGVLHHGPIVVVEESDFL